MVDTRAYTATRISVLLSDQRQAGQAALPGLTRQQLVGLIPPALAVRARVVLTAHAPRSGSSGSPARTTSPWRADPRNRSGRCHQLKLSCTRRTQQNLPFAIQTIEENFHKAGKGLTGLDNHQVRRWDSWYRWTTLAMLALAFLSVTAAAEHASSPPPADQIPLTRNEIAALFSTLIIDPAKDTRHRLRWSTWRRQSPAPR